MFLSAALVFSVVCASLFLLLGSNNETTLTFNWVDGLILLAFLFASLNHEYSFSELIRIDRFQSNLLLFLLYFSFRWVSQRYEMWLCRVQEMVSAGLIVTGCIQSLIAFGQLYGFMSSNNHFFPVTGSYTNPTPLAIHLAISLTVCVQVILSYKGQSGHTRQIIRGLSWANAFMVSSLLPMLMIRTAWLVALAGLSVVLYFKYARPVRTYFKKYRWVVIPGLVAFLLVTGALFYSLKKDSADGRLLVYRVAIEKVWDEPLKGAGWNSFRAHYNEWQADWFSADEGRMYGQSAKLAGSVLFAYNEFIELATEHGMAMLLLAMVLGSWLLWETFIKPSDVQPETQMACIILMGLAAAATTSYPLQYGYFKLLGFLSLISLVSVVKGVSFLLPSFIMKRALPIVIVVVVLGVVWIMVRDMPFHRQNRQAHELMRWGDYASAIEEYEGLIGKMDDEQHFLQAYAKCLSMEKRHAESNEILQVAKKYGSDSYAYIIRGDNLTALGKYGDAESAYSRAIHMAPSSLYPRYQLTMMYKESGQANKARILAQQTLDTEVKVTSTAVKDIHKEMRDLLAELNPNQ